MNRIFDNDHQHDDGAHRPRRRSRDIEDPGRRARRETGDWLTWAIATHARLPRIPLRKVRDGGYAGMMRTPTGRRWAADWWTAAFTVIDLDR